MIKLFRKRDDMGQVRVPSEPRRRAYGLVAEPSEFQDINEKKVLIGGHALYATMGSDTPGEQYIALANRAPCRGLQALRGAWKSSGGGLRVFVHNAAFRHGRVRFALAVDAYLRWGLKEARDELVLIGGMLTEHGSSFLNILFFRNHQLVRAVQRQLPPAQALSYAGAVDAVLDDVRLEMPGARVVQGGPLPDLHLRGVEYVGPQVLTGLAFTPLAKGRANGTSLRLPVLATGGGLLAYGVMIGAGWMLHAAATARYEAMTADPVVAGASNGHATSLEVMEQRRLFMQATRRQELLTSRGTEIIAGVGTVPGVRILELRLPAPSLVVAESIGVALPPAEDDGSPDVHLRLRVPAADMPALAQAKQVLHAVSGKTGLDLYLSPRNGWSEDGMSRTYNVEGKIR